MTQFLQNLKTGKTKHHVICGYIHICLYKEITKKMVGMLNTKFQVVETRVGTVIWEKQSGGSSKLPVTSLS